MKLNELLKLINYNSYVCRVGLLDRDGKNFFYGKSTSDFLNGLYLEQKVLHVRPHKNELDIMLDISFI